MAQITKGAQGNIERIASADGRISYLPIGNDRILIDGRDVWRGLYCDNTTGRATTERVDADLWATACAMMREVDTHNTTIADALREADFARQDARAEHETQTFAALRGFGEG